MEIIQNVNNIQLSQRIDNARKPVAAIDLLPLIDPKYFLNNFGKQPCSDEDPELFTADKDTSPTDRRVLLAKKICETCFVRNSCLEYAIVKDLKYGVWGGLTPRERRPVIRNRNRN